MSKKVELKTPKKYSKVQIEKEIIAQGGKATELQKAMLELYEMESICTYIEDRGASDYYKGTSEFLSTEIKIIREAIREFSSAEIKIIREAIREFEEEIKHISHSKGDHAKNKSYKIER